MPIEHVGNSTNLLEVLEKILDKGIVIAGDIKVSLAEVELLTIKIRLIVASVDKAREIGLDWWERDPYLSSKAQLSTSDYIKLDQRVARLEKQVTGTNLEEDRLLIRDGAFFDD